MERVLRWLRACGNCGTTVGPVDGFCGHCFERVLNLATDQFVAGHPFPVHSLLVWDEGHPIVGNFVRSLKGPWSEFAYSVIAYEVASRANLKGKVIVVPPSKRTGKDHAWNFGAVLAELSGCALLSPFRAALMPEQKRLNKIERAALSFTLAEKVVNSNILFVDDLITTGATARAVWKALGEPNGFSAWTVACRPLRNQL